MDIPFFDIRDYCVPKKGKTKIYDKIRKEKRIVFCKSTSKNSKGEYQDYYVRVWFNRCGGGNYFYKVSCIGSLLFDELPDHYMSIPEETFKLLIQ